MVKGTVERYMKKKIQNNDCYQVVTFQGCSYLHLVAGKFKKSVWETEVFKLNLLPWKLVDLNYLDLENPLMKDLISKDSMLPCQPKSETWEFAIKQVDKVVVTTIKSLKRSSL